MATSKQIKNRNKPKERGRTPRPQIGNYNSILDSIQHVQDKVNANTAKNLENYYEMMEQLANGEGDFKKAGIKDRVMAVRWHIDLAEKFLNEHYESLEEDESSEEGGNISEGKATGTTGNSAQLISLDFNDDE